MAEIEVDNMENNAELFMEKMGFAHDMSEMMDDILGHGGPKVM